MFHIPAHKNTQNPAGQTYPASESDDLAWELAIQRAERQQQRRGEECLAGCYEY